MDSNFMTIYISGCESLSFALLALKRLELLAICVTNLHRHLTQVCKSRAHNFVCKCT